jgi:hypothetical protein
MMKYQAYYLIMFKYFCSMGSRSTLERQNSRKNSGIFKNLKHHLNTFLYNKINWLFDKYGTGLEFSPGFKRLFFKKEIGELYGKKNGNFWKIVLLYFILFISVGFGIQSKRFFYKQLDNPFVRFLTVPIDGEARLVPELVDSLKSKFLKPDLRAKFHLDTIRSVSIQNPAAFLSDYIQLDFDGIADDYNSQLVQKAICSKENNYVGKPFTSIEDRSVIVTLDLLKDLYLVPDTLTIAELNPENLPGFLMFKPSFLGCPVPLVLQGVANQLPYGFSFLLPTKFNDHLYSDPSSVYRDSDYLQISFYIDTLIDAELLKKTIEPVAAQNGISIDEVNFSVVTNQGVHPTMLVAFENVPEKKYLSVLLKDAVKKQFNLDDRSIFDAFYRKYEFPGSEYAAASFFKANKTSLMVIFKNLKKVKSFNDMLKTYSSEVITNSINKGSTKQRKGIEMEMTNVNMRFILNIIEIIVTSFLIIIGTLAVIALVSFIRVLFEKYFQKIEKNIGTFMAFGINIKVVYSIMLTIFIIITVGVSILLAIAGGYAAEFSMIWIFNYSISERISLFSLLNFWSVVALLVIVSANFYAFWKASKIFSKWPGDILNGR